MSIGLKSWHLALTYCELPLSDKCWRYATPTSYVYDSLILYYLLAAVVSNLEIKRQVRHKACSFITEPSKFWYYFSNLALSCWSGNPDLGPFCFLLGIVYFQTFSCIILAIPNISLVFCPKKVRWICPEVFLYWNWLLVVNCSLHIWCCRDNFQNVPILERVALSF